ncbi:MAG: hypothetical protein CMJ49_12105 [Planctomycetaceae bacterium]|nr:hypothetical protein [Planctomycetaceae bacterium]
MNGFVLTLADSQWIFILVVLAISAIGALVKKKAESNEESKKSSPREGGSTAERLQELAEQRRRQLQELARQRQSGGEGTGQPERPTSRPATRAAPAPAPASRPKPAERAPRRPVRSPERPQPSSVQARAPKAPAAESGGDVQRERLRRARAASQRRQAEKGEGRPSSRQSVHAKAPQRVADQQREVGRLQEHRVGELAAEPTPVDAEATRVGTPSAGDWVGSLAALSRDDLRKALILKEVLDQPVGLREGQGGSAGWW